MKRAIIFLNGNAPDTASVKQAIKKTDTIICADGGAAHAVKAGFLPHVVIGDFDSLNPAERSKLEKEDIAWITYPPEKNETDSELVVSYALDKGFTGLVFFGVFGDRYDHVLANLTMFAEISKTVDVTVVDGKQELLFIHGKRVFQGSPGELVSLIPFKDDVEGITTSGLVYALLNEKLYFGKTRGISNVFLKEEATVEITSGVLLAIYTRN